MIIVFIIALCIGLICAIYEIAGIVRGKGICSVIGLLNSFIFCSICTFGLIITVVFEL